MRSPPRIGSVPQPLPRRDGSWDFRKGLTMQHSAVDLESYARMYTEDRLRDATQRRCASQVMTEPSLLERAVARVQSWFLSAPPQGVTTAPVMSRPAQLVPVAKKPVLASADPYAGMIVLVRGPKDTCTLDAA